MRGMASILVAWLCDLLYGMTAGMCDLSAWREELEGHRTCVAELEEKVNPVPRPFEAYTDCPRCGHLDVHRLREPRNWMAPVPAMRLVGPDRWEPLSDEERRQLDESMFDVIRICTKCGHEWGML